MPNVSLTVPTDYSAQFAGIERRRKLAELMQQQGITPIDQPSTPAGGFTPKASWASALAKVLQAGVGAHQQDKLGKEQRALTEKFGKERADNIMQAMSLGQGTAGTPEMGPPTEEGEMQGAVPGAPGSRSAMMAKLLENTDPAISSKVLAEMMKEKASPWSKIDPKDYTAASVTKFAQSQNFADLVPVRKLESITTASAEGLPQTSMINPYQEQPAIPQPIKLSPVTAAGANGQPVTQMTNPYARQIIDQPVKKDVTPGGQVFDPYAIKPGQTMQDPNKPFSLNPEGGVTPNVPFQNYSMQRAQAGASKIENKINSYMPASEEAQKDFIKSSRATYDQLKQAPVALQSIEAAKALIPGAKGFMGPGGESLLQAAKFLNNRLGTSINTEGVKDAETLRTRIFFNIMDNLKKMDAQPSQQQQMIMQEALGKLGTDPNALPAVLDAFGDAIKGKVQLHNQEVQGAVQRGVKFPYDPTIQLPSSSGLPAGWTVNAR